eukprot:CAMPEP_0204527006 /NCGR_PEP_ID=MMETSP0661-20131031/8741_1 /ASSEMBLY_ACC=CAM_ASM_000606 /TAXON_ID=109239 /ORGANISM="Alexandrium margalefi, Strain AMGDE01CS-322" /LENGTH=492 /DNA_ID=CAMNT_0051532873 /DNA_START=13 /DNA_END=1491 /DNA_ORIENTATION=-
MAPVRSVAAVCLSLGIAEGLRHARSDGRRVSVELHGLLPLLHPEIKRPSLQSLNFAMADIYGAPVCPGSLGFVSDVAHAPPNFCRYEGRDVAARGIAHQFHPNWVFDNYALERVMLGKWLASPSLCRGPGGEPSPCGQDRPADIVVVPSYTLHVFLQQGFKWSSFYKYQPMNETETYWSSLAEQYYKPGRTMPLLVVHYPFCFHSTSSGMFLEALSKQPAGFVERVVIAVLEGNLYKKHRVIFPTGGPQDAETTLVQHRRGAGRAAPLLVSLPYPTSLLGDASFLKEGGAYRPDRKRPIAVSMDAEIKPTSWIRNHTLKQMPASKMVCTESQDKYCGLHNKANLWDLKVNSVFCIEPAGDTLTRASFYVAVLSGCIPVIFDGGHTRFDESEPTQWAWRSLATAPSSSGPPPKPFLDYRDFAIVLNATEVYDKGVDVPSMLTGILEREPWRVKQLRRGLDRVAPLMRYAREDCSTSGCEDAFSTFQTFLAQAL